MRFKKTMRGFTLIELLVVIAIIAILAAILFPVFARAREKARTATCQSNLKQMATAVMMYVQDFDERFPGSVTGGGPNAPLPWDLAIQPYVKNWQCLICPSNPRGNPNPWGPYYGFTHPAFLTYSINNSLCLIAMASVSLPSETILLGDSQHAGLDLTDPRMAWPTICADYGASGGCPNKGPISEAIQYAAHSRGNNRAYADGHVKWVTFEQCRPGNYRFLP